MLTKLQLRPGIVRDVTNYSSSGGWIDGDFIRFRNGFPESIGGWAKALDTAFLGVCRSLNVSVSLNGIVYHGIGTHLKFYMRTGGDITDVTPIRLSATLGTDPIQTDASGSAVLNISHTTHGAILNDFVTLSGATGPIDGIPASEINAEHQITSITSTDAYQITVTTTATAGSVSGGGVAVDADYQINVGESISEAALGWGSEGWGEGGWGEAGGTSFFVAEARTWSQANFGEDVIATPGNGDVFYWDATNPNSRMVALADLGGADNAPTQGNIVLVDDRGRQPIVFGCNELGQSTLNELHIRWADNESVTDWNPSSTDNAGSYTIASGSRIVAAEKTRQEILIWTESNVHSMQRVGGGAVFGFTQVATNTTISGKNAAIAVGDRVFWMGLDGFYVYEGRVRRMQCPLEEDVMARMDRDQREKVYAGTIKEDGEVIWFYQSTDSDEIDRYVVHNFEQDIWYDGTLARTAWLDREVVNYPLATATDGFLYDHEFGCSDGSQNPPVAIPSYVESADLEIENGDNFSFVTRAIPDVTFFAEDAGADTPTIIFTLKGKRFPGADFVGNDPENVIRTSSSPVETYTNQIFPRVRGRALTVRYENSGVGFKWRVGLPRLDVRPDGRR